MSKIEILDTLIMKNEIIFKFSNGDKFYFNTKYKKLSYNDYYVYTQEEVDNDILEIIMNFYT